MKGYSIFLIGLLLFYASGFGETLTGFVYQGPIGSTIPLVNVTVKLVRYSGGSEITLATSLTNSSGAFSLTSPNLSQWNEVFIKEIDPSGYISIGAQTLGGTVIDANTIRYTANDFLKQKPLYGNKFWDQAVPNTKPVADADGPYFGLVGRPIQLNGSGSFDPDPNDHITAWYWDLNDNRRFFDAEDGTGEFLSHTWTAPFNGWVRLLVYDTHDAKDQDSSQVVIANGWDFGDAPDPYPTILANNGAAHMQGPVTLGQNLDVERDGLPSENGLGDDHNNQDDEDGVWFNTASSMTLLPGERVDVEAKLYKSSSIQAAHAVIVGWIDFNRDGLWDNSVGSNEKICFITIQVNLPVQTVRFSFTVPPNAAMGHTFARMRLFYTLTGAVQPEENYTPHGFGYYGEVEDYFFNIMPAANRDYGDAPAPYPTLRSQGGASHLVGPYKLGNLNDAEQDGIPSPGALGDDFSDLDDEDGVTFNSMLFSPGDPYRATIVVQPVPNAELPYFVLCSWIDWNGNGVWETSEIFYSYTGTFNQGLMVSLTGQIHQTAALGNIAVRFRLFACRDPQNVAISPIGDGDYGEVEDYVLTIEEIQRLDFGDAPSPYPTLRASNGAFHQIDRNSIRLGKAIDHEPDGQPDPNASGDDGAGFEDDEDGVFFDELSFIRGDFITGRALILSSASNEITNFIKIACWIDFNRDGVWSSAELTESSVINIRGMTEYEWQFHIRVPDDASIGTTICRFRLYISTSPLFAACSPEGAGGTGEVEDYLLTCRDKEGLDYGDAPTGYPLACHPLGGPWLGSGDFPDADVGMNWNNFALGDDNDGYDDENGLLEANLFSGSLSNLIISYVPFRGHSAEKIEIAGWIDFNKNKIFENTERIFYRSLTLQSCSDPEGVNFEYIGFPVPAGVAAGNYILRLRIQQVIDNRLISPTGEGAPGEVEDYLVVIPSQGQPPGKILYVLKWHDQNGDRRIDIDEEFLSNWQFYLDYNHNARLDEGEPIARTDQSGIAIFNDMQPGEPDLREILYSGWEITVPTDGYMNIRIPSGPMRGLVYFGNRYSPRYGECPKWEQPPLYPIEESPKWLYGELVQSKFGQVLAADDWFCGDNAPVIGVTWWGGFENWDQSFLPPDAPKKFFIGIAEQKLAGTFDQPDQGIYGWTVDARDISVSLVDSIYTPGMVKPISCFKYTYINPDRSRWFQQQGDSTHYWISIAPIYDLPPVHSWGWVSREHYFHGNAIQVLEPVSPTGPTPIRRCNVIKDGLDLSFVLHTTDCVNQFDWGDALPPTLKTLKIYNGAVHRIDGRVRLGRQLDAEIDGRPSPNADGDDFCALDDEDGIRSTFILIPGEPFRFTTETSTAGYLYLWIDLNLNGRWDENELMHKDLVRAGLNSIEITLPAWARSGSTNLRFRFTTEKTDLKPYGLALNGEVEDYSAIIREAETAHLPRHWQFTDNTGSNAVIVIPRTARPTVAGDTLSWGDYIGAFNQNGHCCGHARWYGRNLLLTVWGDNPMTPDAVEGFTVGEEIRFRIFSVERQIEFSNVVVEYRQGNGRFAHDAYMIIERLYSITNEITFQKHFRQGWNGFSFNILNTNGQIETALQAISQQIQIIKDGHGHSWLPLYGINTLGLLDPRSGYKVLTTSNCNLNVNGKPIKPDTLISLKRGWNFIGYTPQYPNPASLCFASLGDRLLLAKDVYGHVLIPEFDINTIGDLVPGEAYQLYLTSDIEFRYPAAGIRMAKATAHAQMQPVHFRANKLTGENAVLIIPLQTAPQFSSGEPLAIGDEIGIFSPDGICCGAAVWENVNLAITIWGDDGMTREKDGFYEGDSLCIRLWNKIWDKEEPAQAESNIPLIYQNDQLYVLTKLLGIPETGAHAKDKLPKQFALNTAYPNPFNAVTVIQYDLPIETRVELSILNLRGEIMETLIKEKQGPGVYRCTWNAVSYPSGVYFCRITTDNFTAVKKLALVK